MISGGICREKGRNLIEKIGGVYYSSAKRVVKSKGVWTPVPMTGERLGMVRETGKKTEG